MLDSIHSLTHENLQLGEGILLRGIDPDALLQADDPAAALAEAMQDTSCLIGAAKEGCIFRCVPEMLDVTRGCRTPAAGELLNGRWQATLSGTLLEITPGNTAMLLNAPAPAAKDSRTLLAPECTPLPEAAPDVCWVGSTGSGMLAIVLHSPVSTAGLSLRVNRSGMGEMPFTLLAQQRTPADTALPCRLLWLKGART